MIRYVAAPDGSIVPDLHRKLPGRGAWVTATRAALEVALERKVFARSFRGKAAATADLADLVERSLEKTALEALSLANKARAVITGYARVEAALSGSEVAVLIHARDAAEDGRRKLDQAADRAAAGGKPAARILLFAGAELDLALGRSNVVHAALLAHPASRGFLARCLRFERWRTGGPAGERIRLGEE
jgi:predicted RNA-binding protein YlxR (DUF448 family)